MPSPPRLRLRTPPGLLPDARHVVLPEGIVGSGAPAVVSTLESLQVYLDQWQRDATDAILAKNRYGLYAADTIVLSIARQVGKTFLVGCICFADCIATPGTLVVWTAHRFKVARESFDELRAIAESPALAPHIDKDAITTGAGNETIPFRNGSRIVFAARERGSIRGFRKVRRLVLDEAQILSDAALSDLAPTQNQAKNPQIILMGTPPKPTDPSEAFLRLRAECMSGEADDLAYIEFSAEPGSDPDDRGAWSEANPSYPDRTPERAIRRLRRLLDDDDFMREVLGIWDSEHNGRVIPEALWSALVEQEEVDPASLRPVVFAVAVTPMQDAASISISGRRSDGLAHIEVVDARAGTGWVIERLAALAQRWRPASIVLDAGGPAGSLLPSLAECGVDVTKASTTDYAQACGAFYDAAKNGQFRHNSAPELADKLNKAVAAGRKRSLSDRWAWGRKGSADITPLEAATLALWALPAHRTYDVLESIG
jgi:hypothetical protein